MGDRIISGCLQSEWVRRCSITGSTLLAAECFLRLRRCELIFIWDFVADTVLGQIVDWFYGQIVGFLGNFFSEMGNMGAELFAMSWVQSVVLFFSYLGWALFAIGLVVACFECGVEYSGGRGNVKEAALNAMKGFLAASLFSQVPVRSGWIPPRGPISPRLSTRHRARSVWRGRWWPRRNESYHYGKSFRWNRRLPSGGHP